MRHMVTLAPKATWSRFLMMLRGAKMVELEVSVSRWSSWLVLNLLWTGISKAALESWVFYNLWHREKLWFFYRHWNDKWRSCSRSNTQKTFTDMLAQAQWISTPHLVQNGETTFRNKNASSAHHLWNAPKLNRKPMEVGHLLMLHFINHALKVLLTCYFRLHALRFLQTIQVQIQCLRTLFICTNQLGYIHIMFNKKAISYLLKILKLQKDHESEV